MDYYDELLSWFLMDKNHPDYDIVCVHGELVRESYPTIARASVGIDRKNIRSTTFWNNVMDLLKEDLEILTNAGIEGEALNKLQGRISMVQKVLDTIAG